ncbi:hypothetical protein AYK26_00630 [Euryarchaeota archaeon SM23-78]|nr:MAG: hypothetical protein AYK26_00630 [Euryarchaeota archaeon SM23-78]
MLIFIIGAILSAAVMLTAIILLIVHTKKCMENEKAGQHPATSTLILIIVLLVVSLWLFAISAFAGVLFQVLQIKAIG